MDFITQISKYIIEYAPQYNIMCVSPIIAQACLESRFGESKLSENFFNYFGLKCGSKQTGKSINMQTLEEYTIGTMTSIKDNFRVYDSMEEGAKGYFEFIQLKRYKNLQGIKDPVIYLQTLKDDGYATDSQYVKKCTDIITQYNLTQYDNEVKQMGYDVDKVITIAKSEEGMLEKKNGDLRYLYDKTANAGDANYTKYGYEMHEIYPAVMDYPAPQCDCYVDWCFMMAYGVSNAKKLLSGNFDDYTNASAQLYKDKGAYKPGGTVPSKGWQIFFKNSSGICHTGLVIDYIASSKQVVTIEGNTSSAEGVVSNGGCVRIKHYDVDNSRIDGYGVPAYGNTYAFMPHQEHLNGLWYYRVSDGVNAHGWQNINGHRYYFDSLGVMLKDWQQIDGAWYYFQPSGELEGALYHEASDHSGKLEIWNI